jgi:predicted enzyme related to lactoylglutathione lyase
LIAFLMKTFQLSISQIAQMDLVQIYAITEGYRQMQGMQSKSLSVAELEELMGNG